MYTLVEDRGGAGRFPWKFARLLTPLAFTHRVFVGEYADMNMTIAHRYYYYPETLQDPGLCALCRS